MQWSLFRVLGVLAGAAIVWSLLNQFAGILFLLCVAVAGWRLWQAPAAMPGQRRPAVNRPPPPSPRQQDSENPSAAPAVTSIARNMPGITTTSELLLKAPS